MRTDSQPVGLPEQFSSPCTPGTSAQLKLLGIEKEFLITSAPEDQGETERKAKKSEICTRAHI